MSLSEMPDTLADLVGRLGQIPLTRIRSTPAPGTATEADVIRLEQTENRLFELVDGVLVEKGMGFRESLIAMTLGRILGNFVTTHNCGLVTGADGMVRLFPGLVRIPDVAFISWSRLPGGRVPSASIPPIAPDLVIEVLSAANTPAEMERKRREYFSAGVILVGMVDIDNRTVTVYQSPDSSQVFSASQTVSAEPVLAGCSIELAQLFAELDRKGT